jgi:hypothetical protein
MTAVSCPSSYYLPSIPFLLGQELRSAAVAQAPAAGQTTSAESLKQIIPGHFMYSAFTAGGRSAAASSSRVKELWSSMPWVRKRWAALNASRLRPLSSSPFVPSVLSFHDQYSKGNLAYADVFKVGHDNYRAGLVEQMQRGGASADEQRSRLPNATFRDRMTLYVGGKEIQLLYFGRAIRRETPSGSCRRTGLPI